MPGAEDRRCEVCSDERSGAILSVRGYLGISLLGRTQTWQREAESPAP